MRHQGRTRQSQEKEEREEAMGEETVGEGREGEGEETFTLSFGSPFRTKLNYLVPYTIKHAFCWTSDEIFEMSKW